MVATTVLSLLAEFLLLNNVLCAARASRTHSDMVGALFDVAERVGPHISHVRLLDELGVWVVNHDEDCSVRCKCVGSVWECCCDGVEQESESEKSFLSQQQTANGHCDEIGKQQMVTHPKMEK
jgi:hypothetical protein